MRRPNRLFAGSAPRAVAVVWLIVSACAGGADPPTASTTPTGPSVTATSPRTAGDAPSQSPDEAARDGVVPEVAALPMEVRVEIIEAVTAKEGTWAITRLAPAADAFADGCRIGTETGKYPTDFICTFEYGEVLLLDPDDGRILRALPLPGVPAEFLAVSDDTVYCGRNGEVPMPDTMICRIDRTTGAANVTIYQPGLDSLVVQPCFYPPETWSVIEEPLGMAALIVTGRGLAVVEPDGSRVLLDPVTLHILERGASS